ncbi:hypothetical protein BAC3_00389 [uncultured bacterium]|nr:hypothetical protein BAC3_00389 [uncultured bacterium]
MLGHQESRSKFRHPARLPNYQKPQILREGVAAYEEEKEDATAHAGSWEYWPNDPSLIQQFDDEAVADEPPGQNGVDWI